VSGKSRAQQAEDQFVEEAEARAKERGYSLTFETKCVMRHAFGVAWCKAYDEGYAWGSRHRQIQVAAAMGVAVVPEPEPLA